MSERKQNKETAPTWLENVFKCSVKNVCIVKYIFKLEQAAIWFVVIAENLSPQNKNARDDKYYINWSICFFFFSFFTFF